HPEGDDHAAHLVGDARGPQLGVQLVVGHAEVADGTARDLRGERGDLVEAEQLRPGDGGGAALVAGGRQDRRGDGRAVVAVHEGALGVVGVVHQHAAGDRGREDLRDGRLREQAHPQVGDLQAGGVQQLVGAQVVGHDGGRAVRVDHDVGRVDDVPHPRGDGRVDRVAVLGDAVAELVQADQEEPVGALERGGQRLGLVVVAVPHGHPAAGEVRERLHMPADEDDVVGRDLFQHIFGGGAGELSGGAGYGDPHHVPRSVGYGRRRGFRSFFPVLPVTLSYSLLPPPGVWSYRNVSSTGDEGPPPDEDVVNPAAEPPLAGQDRPSSARVYDYLLGGKDNFAADRSAADKIEETFPAIRIGAQENRRFLLRGVRYLAAEAGIRQFLDIGTGIPTSPNVHEVAQSTTPDARIVYVDNDPVVLVHARALMVSGPKGNVGYLDADIRDPEAIVGSDLVREILDFDEPIALILSAVLHFISDGERPEEIVRTCVEALPPGSFVLASHVTPEHEPRLRWASVGYRDDGVRTRARTAAEFERLVFSGNGLELVPPGIVLVSQWRRHPEDPPAPAPAPVWAYRRLGRPPGGTAAAPRPRRRVRAARVQRQRARTRPAGHRPGVAVAARPGGPARPHPRRGLGLRRPRQTPRLTRGVPTPLRLTRGVPRLRSAWR